VLLQAALVANSGATHNRGVTPSRQQGWNDYRIKNLEG
jgi:hypothetical protein